MKCPYCGYQETKVKDSRDFNVFVRRRRECIKCGKRFTTYERMELPVIYVKKRDGRLERFSRDKIKIGIMKACEKRPISLDKIDEIVDRIIMKIISSGKREITSKKIGEYVMEELRKLDDVAYIRFASVYRRFKDLGSFEREIRKLRGVKVGSKNKA